MLESVASLGPGIFIPLMPAPNLADVRATAEALQDFASRKVCDQEAERRSVNRAYFFITREFELRAALKANEVQKIAREVAEIRLEAGEHGRTWKDREKTCYSSGWADFLEYRTRANTRRITVEDTGQPS